MKTMFIGIAAGALCLNASAQSSVTAYGLIDASVTYARASSTPTLPSQDLYSMSSDASRLGFRGVEDLGGGMSAFFKLEHGFNIDTGAATSATQFWNREAFVGVGDKAFGSVQLGSHFSPYIYTTGKVDPFGRFGLGAILGLLQGAPRGWPASYSNSVQYITPNWSGFVGKLLVSLGEGAATGHSYAASAEYTQGKLYASFNVDQIKVVASTVGLTGNPVKSTTWALGATYDFGVAKLAGWFQRNDIDRLPSVDGYLLGVTVPAGPGEVRATWSHRKETNADATQTAVGYYYPMSKRTWLFTQAGVVKNDGTASYGLGPARAEQLAAGLRTAGRDIQGLQFGMRHTF